jgi:hypothetical protein
LSRARERQGAGAGELNAGVTVLALPTRAGLAAGLHLEPWCLPSVKVPRSDAVVDSSSCNTRVSARVIREHLRGASAEPSLKGEEERCKIKAVVLIRLTPQTPRDSVGRNAPGVSSVVARV